MKCVPHMKGLSHCTTDGRNPTDSNQACCGRCSIPGTPAVQLHPKCSKLTGTNFHATLVASTLGSNAGYSPVLCTEPLQQRAQLGQPSDLTSSQKGQTDPVSGTD